MNSNERVAVCSRSFSKNPILRKELTSKYSEVTFNDAGIQLEGNELLKFLRGHDKAIVALEKIDDYIISRLPELKVISKYGVGLNMIDMEAMSNYNKKIGWTPGVNRRSVSELVLAFAISMLRHISVANSELISGKWRQHIGGQLSGRTVGIIGCGHIGKDLVKLLIPFDCSILVNDIRNYADFYSRYDLKPVSLDDLLSKSDLITLHVPLDDSTKNIIGSKELSLMKPTAFLINTARGNLVDEVALKMALIENRIAGAAFDVFGTEPPQDIELLKLANFLATPHIGGSAEEAILAMGRAAIEGLDSYINPEEL